MSGNKSELMKKTCQQLTTQAIETVLFVMQDEHAKHADRLNAAKIILERGHGKVQDANEIGHKKNEKFVITYRGDE